MKLLHVDSSITGADSVTRTLSSAVVDRLTRTFKGVTVVRRDLAAHPLPYFALDGVEGVAADRTPERSKAASRQVLDEFMDADIVVVGAPMYNFGVPAQLKSWIDWLSVAGATFKYTEKGPVGLAGGKQVIIVSSRGGFYGPDSPAASLEHQESYLRGVFGFFGVTDIQVVQAEGVKVSPDQRERAIAAARAEIGALSTAQLASAA